MTHPITDLTLLCVYFYFPVVSLNLFSGDSLNLFFYLSVDSLNLILVFSSLKINFLDFITINMHYFGPSTEVGQVDEYAQLPTINELRKFPQETCGYSTYL